MRGWLAILALGWIGAVAQAPRITAISLVPPPGRTAAEFLRLVQQPVGQPLDRAAIQASLRALYATGEFRDIEVKEYPTAGGARLEFATTPNFFVSTVRVTGSPDPPDDTELEDAGGLDTGVIYSPALIAQAVEHMQQRLQHYGYYSARIIPDVHLDRATGQAAIAFTVAAGRLAAIGSVHFSGDLAATPATLLRVSGLIAGRPLTRDRLDQASRRLQSFYAAQQRLIAQIALVAPAYHPATNRADMQFQITAGPKVSIRAEGFAVSQGTLRSEVPVYDEHAADLALVEEGRANLLNYLQTRGYFEAQVDDRRTTTSAGALEIVYTVAAGPHESLDEVRFAGNHYFRDQDLAQHVAIQPASAWPAIVPGARGRFSNTLAQTDADNLAQLYRNNGFEQVTVRAAIQRHLHGQAGHIAVTFEIAEGQQTLVRSVRITGATAAHTMLLADDLTTAPRQPYAAVNLAADRNAILTFYFNQGYQAATCDVAVMPVDVLDPDAPPLEDVTYTVHEGPQEMIHSVTTAGNHFVHSNVIAHQLQIAGGQPLSQVAMLQSQRKLYDTGLFTSANVVARNPTGTELDKDVLVTVNEARRYTFSEGVGLQVQGGTGGNPNLRDILGSTGYSPLLSFDATRTAVTGRPQTLSFKSVYGTLQKRAVLGYDIPDFLNQSQWRADLNTFYDDTFDVRTFEAIREQAGVQFEQDLTPNDGWTYSLDYHRVRVLNPLVAPQEIPVLSQPVEVAEFIATYHRDRRDDPLDTHRGTFNSVQVGIAKTYGSGFADFASFDYQNHWYHPLNNSASVVLAGSIQVGTEIPFGSRSLVSYTNPVSGVTTSSLQYVLPLPERYLSGGSDSLRGFAIDQAGPRDPITAFPVGGEALLVNNLELRFPLIGSTLGGVAFYDLGNVYSTPRQMVRALFRWQPPAPANGSTDEDFTSHTLGLGLRYRTPVGPVRLDTGYLLNTPSFQYFSTGPTPQALMQRLPPFHFFFSIGQTF